MVPTFTTHSVGQRGAQLYSGSIATATPQPFTVASPPEQEPGFGVDRRNRDGHALHTGPYPPDLSRLTSYGASTTGSLSLHRLTSLDEPAPSGIASTSRRCRGCSRPPRRCGSNTAGEAAPAIRSTGSRDYWCATWRTCLPPSSPRSWTPSVATARAADPAAWIGKEKLRDALNLRARITRSTPCERDVRGRLFAFYDWCAQNDDIPELVTLARTVSRWEDEIVAAVLTGVSNARSEALNRIAKLEARQAYSFPQPRKPAPPGLHRLHPRPRQGTCPNQEQITVVDGAFIWTPSRDQRPCSLSTALLRGCDPCRPGTAIQVERPQQSEDERPGWSAASGPAWRRPPRSRDVAVSRRSAGWVPPSG